MVPIFFPKSDPIDRFLVIFYIKENFERHFSIKIQRILWESFFDPYFLLFNTLYKKM